MYYLSSSLKLAVFSLKKKRKSLYALHNMPKTKQLKVNMQNIINHATKVTTVNRVVARLSARKLLIPNI